MIESIRRAVAESTALKTAFFKANEEQIAVLARQLCAALEGGNKIILFGNGGSAADAQHIAAEFVGRFQRERRGLPAIALTTDTSILTCVGNDYGFDHVFARQVQALGRPGDVAIGISTSGNSPNVLMGIQTAIETELSTVGFTGKDGGSLGRLVGCNLCVAHSSTARIQEVHIMIGHILCQLVDENLKGL